MSRDKVLNAMVDRQEAAMKSAATSDRDFYIGIAFMSAITRDEEVSPGMLEQIGWTLLETAIELKKDGK